MRSDSRPISGNEVKRFKHLYSTRETPVAPGLVSTIQLGNDVLVPPGAWSGLEEYHGKFITIKDLGRGTIYSQASELILNTTFIQAVLPSINVFTRV